MRSLVVASILLVCTASASIGWSDCRSAFPSEYYPVGPPGAAAICRDGVLAIAYDPIMINPSHSSYFLDHKKEENLLPGRSSFYEDPDLKELGITQAAYKSDAFNTSWNRGHLAPSHALSWTEESKKATYTMANVAPQAAVFNQQPWNHFESDIVGWVTENDRSLYVVTGVGYKDRSKPRRTFDGISVPDYYWKILCDKEAGKSAGWWGENTSDNDGLSAVTTVKDIEDNYFGTVSSGKQQENAHLFPAECRIDTVDKSHWSGIADGKSGEDARMKSVIRQFMKKKFW